MHLRDGVHPITHLVLPCCLSQLTFEVDLELGVLILTDRETEAQEAVFPGLKARSTQIPRL